MKIIKGDDVIVISGKYKGVKGKVIAAYPSESKVVVEGANRAKRHIKPTQDKPGHIEDKEAEVNEKSELQNLADDSLVSKEGIDTKGKKGDDKVRQRTSNTDKSSSQIPVTDTTRVKWYRLCPTEYWRSNKCQPER